MEAVCLKRGVKLGDLSFREQNALWDEAKKIRKNPGKQSKNNRK
jgi:uncharacterized protein YabN with tetrapyrrole methylase and pyrophosphatase domain